MSDKGSDSRRDCFAIPSGFAANAEGCATQCPAGSFATTQAGTATKTCEACPSDSIAQPGSTSCQKCRIGTRPDGTQASCTPTSTKLIGKRSKQPLCLPGHQACRNPKGQLECIDTSSHLTSCGGCPGSGRGTDCTAFDPMATAVCVQGGCRYSCPKGYRMAATGCERIKGNRYTLD